MSKRYFEVLATELKFQRPSYNGMGNNLYKGWRMAVEAVAFACEKSNPRFNRDRFIKACGA